MAKKPQTKKPTKIEVEDEPGAEGRFRETTKRLLSTPPKANKSKN